MVDCYQKGPRKHREGKVERVLGFLRLFPVFIVLSILVMFCSNPAGNNNGGGQTGKVDSISLCNSTIARTILGDVIDGDMVVVGTYLKDGDSLSHLVGGLIYSMVVTGIDFSTLSATHFSFANGIYSYRTPGHAIDLVFYFAEDYGAFHSGDTIPYNFFSTDSYVTNVQIGLNGVTYDNGPLYDIVQGSISFDNLTPVVSVQTTKIAFTVKSAGQFSVRLGNYVDSLLVTMTTARATIQTFRDQLDAGGFGFSYDSSVYKSKAFNINETIYGSMFYMKKNGQLWYWEGYYSGNVHKGNLNYFMRGLASNIRQNYTGYFCDPVYADSFGVAIHDTSLTFGHFYSIYGDTLLYLLSG